MELNAWEPDYHEFNWQWRDNENVDTYRRSMVPFYLLEHEAINYPRYVDFSDLSKNLS